MAANLRKYDAIVSNARAAAPLLIGLDSDEVSKDLPVSVHSGAACLISRKTLTFSLGKGVCPNHSLADEPRQFLLIHPFAGFPPDFPVHSDQYRLG